MSPDKWKSAVFIDRDGVLCRSKVIDGKPYAPRRLEDFHVFEGAKSALQRLRDRGFMLIVVTNQPDVGNGLVTRDLVDAMNARLCRELPIDSLEVCFHAQTDGCACRKPKPGMLIAAAARFDIDLQGSFMVGDRRSDIEAGKAAGCKTVFIDRHYSETPPASPDFEASSIEQAADLIAAAAVAASLVDTPKWNPP